MLPLFDKRPPLDEAEIDWLFQSWRWALENFDSDVFFNETILVIPSNDYFPGRENSIPGMARLIFEQVRKYAGVSHWPCRLVEQGAPLIAAQNVVIGGALRGPGGQAVAPQADSAWLTIPYNPHQVGRPEALIADYAQVLAWYLGSMGKVLPPGGEKDWPYATEVLATFMGFGLMVANSAYNYRGGCGSCYNPLAQRQAWLSQDEAVYALAIFAALKDIPDRQVLRELKSYLRPVYRIAIRDIRRRRGEQLQPLKAMAPL